MKKIIIIFAVIVIVFCALCYFGIWWPNNLFAERYSVQGIDVSNYQKDIDWSKVSKNKKIKFAYIKATEGRDFKDRNFKENWNKALEAGLYKGAYHYFTIKSSGRDQAENFISVVPDLTGCMPPVVDIEESGLKKEVFRKELGDFLSIVEKRYGKKTVLYVVYPLYHEYIKGEFRENPIWIRDIIKPPSLGSDREWMFWQYSERGRIEGINTYVDLDVFSGDINKFKAFINK
ncbi:MAG TPA: GH25 family lysozyme [Clostridia bacterium]